MTDEPEAIPPPEARLAALIDQLDVHQIYADHFHGHVDQGEGRLFGGLVLGQALMSAGRTTIRGVPHSMHGYFLRPGKPEDVLYGVERLREGRTFIARRVTAVQGSEVIFEATVEFVIPEPGIAHQAPPPPVARPEGLPLWTEVMLAYQPDNERLNNRIARMPIEIRGAESHFRIRGANRTPYRAVWMRPLAPLPEDALVHAAAIAYASDMGMTATVSTPYRMVADGPNGSSLDHAIWWHQPPRFDDWMLYETESPAAHSARALYFGGMWNEQGERVVSVAQEGLFRGTPGA